MNAIVSLDLATGIAEVRKQLDAVLAEQTRGLCCYTGPCVVGAMVPHGKRHLLDEADDATKDGSTSIKALIAAGLVCVPDNQRAAFARLQDAFDKNNRKRLLRLLDRYEAKFAASAIEARSDATGTGAAEGKSAIPQGDAQ